MVYGKGLANQPLRIFDFEIELGRYNVHERGADIGENRFEAKPLLDLRMASWLQHCTQL
jgi:hypothetical protein